MEYAENGTDSVATYTGLDPEGRPIYWSLLRSLPTTPPVVGGTPLVDGDFADEGHFSISSDGVLSFMLPPPPDFETPKTLIADTESLAARNVYKIVVVASDDAPGAAVDEDAVDIRMKAYHKVTVTDVDEDGSISLSTQQPQMGVELTATLADQDTITDAKWKWEQGTAMNGPWTVIVGDTAATMEMPVAGLVGKYLRATATYTDAHGNDKSAMAVSANAVRAVPGGTNSSPAFPDGSDARSVKENSPPGTNVGKPVAAGDAGDILTYTLTGSIDDSKYLIDRATGQITVGPRTMLDREGTDIIEELQHTVMVTATDPWGITETGETQSATAQSVSITIDNVNEAPSITGGVTRSKQAENEDADESAGGIQLPPISIYLAVDMDADDTQAWSLTGPDAGELTIDADGQLTFKANPNFESPVDADMDNVYMVTVVATDAGTSTDRSIGVDKLTATRDVVITVTNADDGGTVTLSSVQPKVGIDLVATLTDEDGSVKDIKWQWYDGQLTSPTPTPSPRPRQPPIRQWWVMLVKPCR